MRALLLALLILPAWPSARAEEDEEPSAIQRYLVDVQLGDSVETAQRVYPPAAEWPATVDDRSGVTRYRVVRSTAKAFPARVDALYLGFKKGRLVEIEVVYDAKKSGAQPVEKLAGEYALVYGPPKRSGDRFWWSDGKTVLRVFPFEVPVSKDGDAAVSWLTAVQVFEHGLSSRSE